MRKIGRIFLGIVFAISVVGCSKSSEVVGGIEMEEEQEQEEQIILPKLIVDQSIQYQTIESFGASGAWWSQYVGGWDEPYKEAELSTREQIATWLYSKEEGIGLTSYRYNLGAGSMDTPGGDYWDKYRQAQSFEVSEGIYDFTKDEEAQWMLNRVVELGAEEIILFANSPLERLTISGQAYGDATKASKSNMKAENYTAFAKYIMDCTEYFVEQGLPIRYVSPINEPQWDWTGGQEGCHYEPSEIAGVYLAFLDELESREGLEGIELSGPESGEWGGKTTAYVSALLSNERLAAHFETIDNHSYWTDLETKVKYKKWMDTTYPNVKLRTSEWCEMVNGSDYTMDSAFNMFDVIYEDLTVLDVVSWQCWVAVAPGNYRDGLIYVNQEEKACRAAKRLWGYGNYTKFVRPGFVRVELQAEESLESLHASAYVGEEEESLVLALSNREEEKEIQVDTLGEDYKIAELYVTNEELDLAHTVTIALEENSKIVIPSESIVTVVFSK